MRKLSDRFMHDLTSGFLAGITEAVVADKDLDLQIRDNYLNIYAKGHSLVKLSPAPGDGYRAEIHAEFLGDLAVSGWEDEETVASFVVMIPTLKANIARYARRSLEIEYEQLIVRANNRERRNNSEIFIVDRQYTVAKHRLDLLGFFWARGKRRRGDTVAPCLMEVKFALNSDIARVDEQLARYYQLVSQDAAKIAAEMEGIFRQRLRLGLYDQPPERLEAMETLTFHRDIDRFQFILVLVDYNPNSMHLDREAIARLPFASQVRIFHGGFAMWAQDLKRVT
jgi:hypothetical protein